MMPAWAEVSSRLPVSRRAVDRLSQERRLQRSKGLTSISSALDEEDCQSSPSNSVGVSGGWSGRYWRLRTFEIAWSMEG